MIGIIAVTASGHQAATALTSAWPKAELSGSVPSGSAVPSLAQAGAGAASAAWAGVASSLAASSDAMWHGSVTSPDAGWLGEVRVVEGRSAAEAIREAWRTCDAIVCFLAVGATVRIVAPLLKDKTTDPAVVCVDEALRFAVPLVGGHHGANQLAARVADVLGCTPVITTASDAAGVTPLDEYGADLGFTATGDFAAVGAAILSRERVTLSADAAWPLPALPINVVRTPAPEPGVPAIVISDLATGNPASPHEAVRAGIPVHQTVQREDHAVQSETAQGRIAGSGAAAGHGAAGQGGAGHGGAAKAAAGHGGVAKAAAAQAAAGPGAAAQGGAAQGGAERGRARAGGVGAVGYWPASLVVGVGSSRGASEGEIGALIDGALADAGLAPQSVCLLATIDVKAREPGIVEAARRRGWDIVTYPAEVLASVAVPNPSEVVRAEVGTPSVAEAAALHAAAVHRAAHRAVHSAVPAGPSSGLGQRSSTGEHDGPVAELVVPKRRSANATVAVARLRPRGRLSIIGLGPGARDLLTGRAVAELRRASVIVGLDQYVDQVRDLLRPGTRVLASGLGDEEARARMAVGEARDGHAVALIGSGDAGVYAMASPALDRADARDIDVVGVPGITAATAAAALLGAPLGHDHAYISLSDLHTPWEAIERRVTAAAEGDFTVCFYNPRSRARDWQLPKALEILTGRRPPDVPVGWVRNASRAGEFIGLTTLAAFDPAVADMYTVVIVGSSQSRIVGGRFVTPRGYRWSR